MPIKLEIVTAERIVLEKDVDIVVAPGAAGVMGILPNHAPLLTSLKVGELKYRVDNEEQIFAIGGGFMEVQPNKVTVLADAAERDDEISIERARAARERAEKALESGNLTIEDQVRMEGALRRAMMRLRVAERRKNR